LDFANLGEQQTFVGFQPDNHPWKSDGGHPGFPLAYGKSQMDPVSDSFLLTLASNSAGLTGLFVVGMTFYIRTGFSQLERSREVVEPYFRDSTRIVLILYSIPFGVSLTLVALSDVWSRLLYLVLTVSLVATNVSTASGVRPVTRVTGNKTLLVNEVIGTAGVALMVILPLATGGFSPDREDLVPALLISLGIAFLSTVVLLLTLFDIARFERVEKTDPKPERSITRLWKRHADGAARNSEPSDEPSSDQRDEPPG
jgi:hypothetical protein